MAQGPPGEKDVEDSEGIRGGITVRHSKAWISCGGPMWLCLREVELAVLTPLPPAPTGKGPVSHVPASNAPHPNPGESEQTVTITPTY